MKKLVLGVTVGGSSKLLVGQVSYFIEKGYQVYLMSPDHEKERQFCNKEGCIHLPVPIEKEIAPLKDLKALFSIIGHLRKVKPDIVNVGTPKMGLLGTMASWMLGINRRIFTCRGLRYEGDQGFKRILLMAMERLSVFFASDVIYVGHSLMRKAIKYKTADVTKSHVIGQGSSNGVNLQYFNPDRISEEDRQRVIGELDLKGKTVLGFVGRISKSKGSYELYKVFDKLWQNGHKEIVLILIGHKDCSETLEKQIEDHPAIIYLTFQEDIALYMSVFDLFILPSWREGFSNVSIQVAAMGLPLITTDATGCDDSVKDGYNGTIFSVRSEEEMEKAIKKYFDNPSLIKEHGENGKEWVQLFRPELIWDGLDEIYSNLKL